MIKTRIEQDDLLPILELGRKFHQESQYKDTEYDEARVTSILAGTITRPESLFIAYDSEYRGVILLQLGTEFFSNDKWVGDQAFYVIPEARRSGLAHDLLEAGENWARSNGAKDFTIFHNAGLHGADSFYAKEGFNLSGHIFNKQLKGN